MHMHAPARVLAAVLTTAAIGLAACGDDGTGDDSSGEGQQPTATSSTAAEQGRPLLIKTRVEIEIPEGTLRPGDPIGGGNVQDGSTLGEEPFCPGGTFRDRHGNEDTSKPPHALVDRTFRCPDGTLRVGFTPGQPSGDTQRGGWGVVSGTGVYKGLDGEGAVEVTYTDGARASKGNETFTGTVTP
jgi:hypothetical protein